MRAAIATIPRRFAGRLVHQCECCKAGEASVSGQVIDRAIPHSSIDDAPSELTATRDGRFLCGVGPRAAEGPQVTVAADQEIEGPASGATYLERARRDGEALVRGRIQPDSELFNHTELYRGGPPGGPAAVTGSGPISSGSRQPRRDTGPPGTPTDLPAVVGAEPLQDEQLDEGVAVRSAAPWFRRRVELRAGDPAHAMGPAEGPSFQGGVSRTAGCGSSPPEGVRWV